MGATTSSSEVVTEREGERAPKQTVATPPHTGDIDPRSPTNEIYRTPLQPAGDCRASKTELVCDPRSPSSHIDRTPLAVSVNTKGQGSTDITDTTVKKQLSYADSSK